jgi:hypothetical protein
MTTLQPRGRIFSVLPQDKKWLGTALQCMYIGKPRIWILRVNRTARRDRREK